VFWFLIFWGVREFWEEELEFKKFRGGVGDVNVEKRMKSFMGDEERSDVISVGGRGEMSCDDHRRGSGIAEGVRADKNTGARSGGGRGGIHFHSCRGR
jgi:hypothetical protein